MTRDLRGSFLDVARGRMLPGVVIDVVRNRCSVRLSGNGAVLRGVRFIGGPVSAGEEVVVSFESGMPVAMARGPEPTTTTTKKTVRGRTVARDNGGAGGGIRPEHTHALDDLSDVDASSPAEGQILAYDAPSETWEPRTPPSSPGVSFFLDLTDTPDAYTGQAQKLVAVNGAENSLEFIPTGAAAATAAFVGTVLLDQTAAAGGKEYFEATSIPTGFYRLEITLSGKTEHADSAQSGVRMLFNSDTTATNYRYLRIATISTYGPVRVSGDDAIIGYIGTVNNSNETGALRAVIPDPNGTATHKTVIAQSGAITSSTENSVEVTTMTWESTASITDIKLTTEDGSDFAEGARCTIIGYKNMAIGADDFLLVDGSNQASWTPVATVVANLNADTLDGNHAAAFLLTANNLSDVTAGTARSNLGLTAGGAGDIWVEKAGDTMTGDLVIKPTVGSATTIDIYQSDGSTRVLSVNTITQRVGIARGANAVGSTLQVGGNVSQVLYGDTPSGGPTWMSYRGRGTEASPTTVESGDREGGFFFYGHSGAGMVANAAIIADVGGTVVSDTIVPGSLTFETMGTTSASRIGRMTIYPDGNVTVNEGGIATADFRAEGDTDANLFRTDASADCVGIGTGTPGAKLQVQTAVTTRIGQIVKLAASHTANAFEVQASTGTILTNIEPDGEIAIPQDSKAIKLGGGNDLTVYYDGTSGYINAAAVAASDMHLACGTDKTLVLDETVWVDLDFPIIVRTTGAAIPTLQTLQGNITAPQWAVNDYNVCEGQEMIHGWKEGGTLNFHVHLITNGLDADNRYVAFEVEHCWANINGVLSAAATISSGDLLIPAGTTSKTHLLLSIGTLALATGKIGAHVYARLKRVAASGTAPTNNPWITMLQAHIECDTLGSRQIGTK